MIADVSNTFDQLRIIKAADFPELKDGYRVLWTVEYGKNVKLVTDPMSITIGNMKAHIEASTEFQQVLKEDKNTIPICKVKPRILGQIKGQCDLAFNDSSVRNSGEFSSYKAVFTNLAEVDEAAKAISIIPAKDGKVYEIRNNEIGKFITPVVGCELLSEVQAGFIPALPLIPMDLMIRIISFFRYYMYKDKECEVLVNLYWDRKNREFIVDAPEQIVSSTSVESLENLNFVDDRYLHYMDIHSHNSMKAFFSSVDDSDEKATRLYTVIGSLHKYFPDVKTRISNGGKFHEIDPSEVFELVGRNFPECWKDNVRLLECG